MKIHRIELGSLLVVLALCPAAAQAQSAFRVYGGLAPTTYKISFDQNAPYSNQTAKSSYTAANLGVTWISPKGIYVDFAAQQSLSAHHDLWDSVTSQKQDFSHDTYTLTAGYSHPFAQGASVSGFGGFTKSTTVLHAPRPPFAFSKDTFDSQGIFVGAGAGVPALSGQFSGSIALAVMKGKWKDDNTFNNTADATVGFSLGGAYTYPITPALGVTADLRYQQYKYNFDVVTTSAYTVTEKIASLGVRLGYRF
jgi:outer membrane protein with beta-barrel domain